MAAALISDQADCEPEAPCPRRTSRRQQILEAAGQCFRQSGFHAASMASIAGLAGQSVGQIYRYFANKEAIIAAIVDQHLVELRETFDHLESLPGSTAHLIADRVPEILAEKLDLSRAGLVLEVLAEAARNPKIAAILRTRWRSCACSSLCCTNLRNAARLRNSPASRRSGRSKSCSKPSRSSTLTSTPSCRSVIRIRFASKSIMQGSSRRIRRRIRRRQPVAERVRSIERGRR